MHAILWDFDGTIADTTVHHYQAWQASFQEYGINHTYEEFFQHYGRSNGEIIPLILPGLPLEEVKALSQRKEARFRQALMQAANLQPLPGVRQWLEDFRRAGIPQAVASSAPMANIVAGVAALGIEDHFHSLMSAYHLPEGKPHPAIFLNSAAALVTNPTHCIVIEDSPAGVEAARRAGMASIVVGELAHNGKLDAVLERTSGRNCLAIGDLERLTWGDIERLWG